MKIARQFPPSLVRRFAASLSKDAGDESAIPSYTHWNPAIRWLMFRRLEVIRQMALQAIAAQPAVAAQRAALDYGCGIGMLIPTLSPAVGTLFLCDEQIAPAQETAKWFGAENIVPFLPQEFDRKVADSTLDVIIAADVLEHVEDLPDVLVQFRRKLREGGRLIVSGPTENQAYRVGRWIAGFSGDYHVRDVYNVEDDVMRGGFSLQVLHELPIFPRLFRITQWCVP